MEAGSLTWQQRRYIGAAAVIAVAIPLSFVYPWLGGLLIGGSVVLAVAVWTAGDQ